MMRDIRKTIAGGLLLAAFSLLGAETVAAQSPRAELVQRLLGEDRDARSRAAAMVRDMDPDSVGPELRHAILQALAEEEAVLAQQRRGDEVRGESQPAMVASLAHAASHFDTPAVIPVLVGAMDLSPPAVIRLARFGEAAVPAILHRMDSEERGAVKSMGLLALRFIVEEVEAPPVAPGIRRRIESVASDYMTSASPAVVIRALDLAVALGSAELMREVESIVSDPKRLHGQGITAARHVELVQEHARDRLSGVPARPEWHLWTQ